MSEVPGGGGRRSDDATVRLPAPVVPDPGVPRRSKSFAEAATVQADAPPVSGSQPRFATGDLVGQRYRIVRFVAEGGMGQVYEVEDLELHEHLALKTLHPSMAGDSALARQFKREVQLARKVTHPNVCRMYDVGSHLLADGSAIAFLTMELLAGETLRQRLTRGPLPEAEARDVAAQLAMGLAAAHAAGIVHRDFKSDNVMLLPGGRVVITDFGVAVQAAGADTRGFVGTPAYIAPELIKGAEATSAADYYSFGVVLYEMLTSRLPFAGESAIELAMARLGAPPPRLDDVDPELADLAEQCLLVDPAARLQEVQPRLLALTDQRVYARRWPLVLALAALVVLIAGGLAVWRHQTGLVVLTPIGIDQKALHLDNRRMLVRQLRGDPAWAGPLLQLALVGELGQPPRFPTLRLDEALVDELRIGTVGKALAPASLPRLARLGTARYVVDGQYSRSGERWQLTAWLFDTWSDAESRPVQLEGTDLPDLVRRAGEALRDRLPDGGPSPLPAAFVPVGPAAQEAWGQALAALATYRTGQMGRALDRLQALEPDFPGLVWGRMSLALAGLLDVDTVLRGARVEDPRLPVELRQFLTQRQGMAMGTSGSQCPSVEASADRATRLEAVTCAFAETRWSDGLALLDQLWRAGDYADDPIRLVDLRVGGLLSSHQYERAESEGRRCVAMAKAAGATIYTARCGSLLAAALRELSRWDEAETLAREMLRLIDGEQLPVPTDPIYGILIAVAQARGDLPGQRRLFEERVRAAETADLGVPGRMRILVQESLLLADAGEIDAARKLTEDQLLPLLAESHDAALNAYVLNNLAILALRGGDVRLARSYSSGALAMAQQDDRRRSYSLLVSASIEIAAGNSAAARERALIASGLRQHLHLARLTLQAELIVASADAALGHADLVLARVRPFLEHLPSGATISDRMFVLESLGLAYLALGRREEALVTATELAVLASAPHAWAREPQRMRSAALILGVLGDQATRRWALSSLEAMARTARRTGSVLEALDLELSIAKVELAGGQRALARQRAARVVTEARRLGLLGLVRRAEQLGFPS